MAIIYLHFLGDKQIIINKYHFLNDLLTINDYHYKVNY